MAAVLVLDPPVDGRCTPSVVRPRRYKLLQWGKKRGEERTALHAAIDAEIEDVRSNLRDIRAETSSAVETVQEGSPLHTKARLLLQAHTPFLCRRLVAQDNASTDIRGPLDGCAAEALVCHALLARLFACELTSFQLSTSHLCCAQLLQEASDQLFEVLSHKDQTATHHCLGLAHWKTGRNEDLADRRAAHFKSAERHLRDGIALLGTGGPGNMVLPDFSTQGEQHADLAGFYAEMWRGDSSPSCLSASGLHFSKAADKFAAAGQLSRCLCVCVCVCVYACVCLYVCVCRESLPQPSRMRSDDFFVTFFFESLRHLRRPSQSLIHSAYGIR